MKNSFSNNFSFIVAMILTNLISVLREEYNLAIILTGITFIFISIHLIFNQSSESDTVRNNAEQLN
ncbi:MAG: hypothetical protein AMXMBFR48_15760 [Ignavibacteriales bacterium]|jgi:hypothetical protein